MSVRVALVAALAALTPALAHAQQYEGRDPAECAPMSTPDVEVYAYRVRAGDSCARVAISVLGARDRYALIHRYNPNMGPTPHRLRVGSYLCLPRSGPGAPPDAAQITALRQEVRRRPPDDEVWGRAVLGEGLQTGARVDVRRRAFAELTFWNTSVITLRGDTLVVVYGRGTRQLRQEGGEATLERGALRTRLGELRLRVRTPVAEVGLDGGDAVTSVDGEGVSRVSVHTGRQASVRGESGAARPVPPGNGSAVRQGEPPTPPVELPPAPEWRVETPTTFVGVPTLTTVRGAWTPVPRASVYRVELARHPDGRELVAAMELPAQATAFELHRLPPGVYYASVATIDEDSFESAPSAYRRIEVAIAGVHAPGEDGPVGEAEFDHGDASEDPQPLAVLPGTRVHLPDGMRCALHGGEHRAVIEMSRPGTQHLECFDQADRPVGIIDVRVAPVTLSALDGQDVELAYGEVQSLVLQAGSDLPLPEETLVVGSEGYRVVGLTRAPRDRVIVQVEVDPDAPDVGALELQAGHATLASLPVHRTADAPAGPGRLRASELFGGALGASLVGVRDLGRTGVSAWGTFAVGLDPDDRDAERRRLTFGAHGALLDRRLVLEVAATADLDGFGVDQGAPDRPDATRFPTAQRGQGDLWVAAGSLVALGPADLRLELGAWLPTQASDPGGLDVVRLAPTAHVAWRVNEGPWLLRTRQGAALTLDAATDGVWASAYAVDVRVGPVVQLGAELQLTVGEDRLAFDEPRGRIVAPVVGLRGDLLAGPLVLGLGARLSASDDARQLFGLWSVVATVGGGLWDLGD